MSTRLVYSLEDFSNEGEGALGCITSHEAMFTVGGFAEGGDLPNATGTLRSIVAVLNRFVRQFSVCFTYTIQTPSGGEGQANSKNPLPPT